MTTQLYAKSRDYSHSLRTDSTLLANSLGEEHSLFEAWLSLLWTLVLGFYIIEFTLKEKGKNRDAQG
jgi:hypothetical protein